MTTAGSAGYSGTPRAKKLRIKAGHRVVWLAWPKKTSGIDTDLTGDVVRAAILATTLVDIKVGAISDTWSALKPIWRRELR